jgi:uncharacterized membrane protein YhfC
MNTALLSINYALMILIPIVVAIFIRRRTGAPWRLFFIGAVTFIASQVLHIPFNAVVLRSGLLSTDTTVWSSLIIYAAFLGLSAGVFEETARYLTYRFWAKDARSWSRGLMLGAGHGGSEAILVGALAAVNFVALLVTVNNETAMNALPADQRSLVTSALAQIMDAPTGTLLLGAVERLFAITAHLAMSLLVLQVFLRRNIAWLFASIGFHTLLNMVAVIAASRLSPFATEGIIGLFALLALVIIFRLRTPEPEPAPEPEALPPPVNAAALDLHPTDDALDRSRYSGE